ncbi:MAG: hypothetical protein J6R04_03820 [Clostridia bacterium]|nr:hypothetical protein [Clostridia bacterium]
MKKLLALTALPLLLLSLTSCEVHWFNQSYDVPWYVVALITACIIIPTILLTGHYLSQKTYRCSSCGMTFHPKWHCVIVSIHLGAKRVLRCPHCKHKGFCNPTDE